MNLEQLREALSAAGLEGLIANPDDVPGMLIDARSKYHSSPDLIVRPTSAQEISKLVEICVGLNVPITPIGGNTGLVGGACATSGVLLSLDRMSEVIEISPEDGIVVAQAGCVLETIDEAAKPMGLKLPLWMGSQGSATVGGAIATNAGGAQALRFGSMRSNLMGVSAVLADGSIISDDTIVQKNNSGISAAALFAGTEGTLAIIYQAVLRLVPIAADTLAFWLCIDDPGQLGQIYGRLRRQYGVLLSACEFMNDFAVSISVKHVHDVARPVESEAAFYLLVEIEQPAGVPDMVGPAEEFLGELFEEGAVTDGAVAQNEAQRLAFWRVREGVAEAQPHEGASLKHDVAVPVSKISRYLENTADIIERLAPGARPCAFGHLGDGNIHYQISQSVDANPEEFTALTEEIAKVLHDEAVAIGGSFSAEHGIGLSQKIVAARLRPEGLIRMSQTVKDALDPTKLLNPGKLYPDQSEQNEGGKE